MATDEVSQYVAALRSSSDRARYVLYIIVTFVVLMFITTHNVGKDSWPRRRLDAYYQYARDDQKTMPPPKKIANGDAERLKALRAEYVKQFATRAVFAATPVPGISIDVNDLGLIGGITLLLLMIVLLACMEREHENLYLALFKVRRLCENNKNHSNGASEANLLYHALAMTQVLNTPPTLARWQRAKILNAFRILFVGPAAVYGWVVWSEWETRPVSRAYGVDVTRTVQIEAVVALTIFVLGIIAALHSRAMALRWTRAFFRVNPARAYAPEMTYREWLKLTFRGTDDRHTRQQQLKSALVTMLVCLPAEQIAETDEETDEETVYLECDAEHISHADLNAMVLKIEDQGRTLAEKTCKTRSLGALRAVRRFAISKTVLQGARWSVSGKWHFAYYKKLHSDPSRTPYP